MSNNRVQYSVCQLGIKDYKIDSTTHARNTTKHASTGTLASGISAADGQIGLNETIDGVWPSTGMVRIKTGTAVSELIRYGEIVGTDAIGDVTRGAAGTTAATHDSSDVVMLEGWEYPMGVQSVSIGTTFNTEDVFHLGQLDAYENVEGIPDVEMTIERLLDGTKPLFLMCTDDDYSTLKGKTSDYRIDAALSIYPDSQDSAQGTPDSTVVCSGMYISSWTTSWSASDNWTESVTLVGNDKQWGYGATAAAEGHPSGAFIASDEFDAAVIGSGIQRSEDYDSANSTTPTELPSADHIQSIEVSVDLTREEIYELGTKTPYYRAIDFPVTVTTTFETITDKGDLVNAIGHTGEENLANRTIILKSDAGLTIDLGTKNKLASLELSGADAGGGNLTATYEYTNSNSLSITHDGFVDWYSCNF